MKLGLVVKLRPAGPWRIGPDSGARNRVDVIYHSDSLYSAVTSAMARMGMLDAWLDATARSATPAVCFSSSFPFLDEISFVVPPRTLWPPTPRGLATSRVRWKSARFVPMTVVKAILAGERLNENQWSVDGASGCLVPVGRPGPFRTGVRWNAAVDRLTGASERHSTACIEFRPGCGLWAIAGFAGEAARDQWQEPVKAAFRLLADTGFGGERSRGWGRSETPEFSEGILPEMIIGTMVPRAAAAVVEQYDAAPPSDPPPSESLVPDPESDQSGTGAFACQPTPADPIAVDAQPTAAETEFVVVEPEALAAEPIAAVAEPEAPAAEPESPIGAATLRERYDAAAPAEPSPAEPAVVEPEAPAAETAVVEPEAPAAELAPDQSGTGDFACQPAPAEPVAVDAEPAAAEPESVVVEPESPAAEPVGVEAEAATEPEPVVVEPEALAAEPETVAVELESAAAPEPAAEPEPIAVKPLAEPDPALDLEPALSDAPLSAILTAPDLNVSLRVSSAAASPALQAHWMLSLFSPAPADTVDWARGNYTVLARGGRIDSPSGSGELKKQIQMVAEGSVLYADGAPLGAAPDVAPDGFAHPVFRAGFALTIPLPEVH